MDNKKKKPRIKAVKVTHQGRTDMVNGHINQTPRDKRRRAANKLFN